MTQGSGHRETQSFESVGSLRQRITKESLRERVGGEASHHTPTASRLQGHTWAPGFAPRRGPDSELVSDSVKPCSYKRVYKKRGAVSPHFILSRISRKLTDHDI